MSGPHVLVTADTAVASGSVTVHVRSEDLPGGAVACDVLAGRNVTDLLLDGCDLSGSVGKLVKLELQVTGGASLHVVGFHK